MTEQLALDTLHPCPTCGGTGRRIDRETGRQVSCRVCEGTGNVDYDPGDMSIPFGAAA